MAAVPLSTCTSPPTPTALPDPAVASRARGALLGLAVGDALGAAVEFRRPGSFAPLQRDAFTPAAWARHPNPHRLRAGQWTDDTSMALCLGQSLVEAGVVDPAHQLGLYRQWAFGAPSLWSSTGACFDIGRQTHAALARPDWAARPALPMCADPSIVGANGCIMRAAPLPIWQLLREPSFAARAAGAAAACRTTHSTPACVQACILLGELLRALLGGAPKEAVLTPEWLRGVFHTPAAAAALAGVEGGGPPLHPAVEALLGCGWRGKAPGPARDPAAIAATAEAPRTLEAALWALDSTASFAEGALLAANLGDDSDTVGAVYGQLAGAAYGLGAAPGDAGVPPDWVAVCARAGEIAAMADALLGASGEGAAVAAPPPAGQ